jgi:serine/threonine-protein kinase BUR1
MDHDLSGMTTNPDISFTEAQIKCYMLQLLEGLRYLHDSHILHRDMKGNLHPAPTAANILINNRGLLQIADFGLARHYDGPVPQPGRGNGDAVRDYTTLVVTRWYRPPELLLQLRRYTPAIDMWGAGYVALLLFAMRHSDNNQLRLRRNVRRETHPRGQNRSQPGPDHLRVGWFT